MVMKTLPLNTNPLIRAFTHHMFVHSIISRDDSVGNHLATISFPFEDKIDSRFIKITNNANFEISKNEVRLFSPLYADSGDNIIYRACEKRDEMVVKVDYQQNSKEWGISLLFIKKQSDLSASENMENCDIQFGKFNGNVLLFYDNKEKLFINHAANLPYWLKLVVNKHEIIACFSSDGIEWIEINRCEVQEGNDKRIMGVCFNLQANEYYDWLFANYIQLVLNINNNVRLEYLSAPYKNFLPYSLNPFINFLPNRREVIEAKYNSILYYPYSVTNI